MSEVSLIFPHQLYENHPALLKSRGVILVEDELYFNQYKFHKQKIILHRASMKAYEAALVKRGFITHYLDAIRFKSLQSVFEWLVRLGAKVIHYAEVDDYLLLRRLTRFSSKHGIQIKSYESTAFICSLAYLKSYFESHPKYFLNDFYIAQRKRLNILIDRYQPKGGQWNFDSENRKKIPTGLQVPERPKLLPINLLPRLSNT